MSSLLCLESASVLRWTLGFRFNAVKRSICLFVSLIITANVFAEPAAKRPNIVLILADDLGFSDIAPYGSEINTPTLSALADVGIKFSNFHTSASCAPSRAMLLTGVDNHRAGVPSIPEAIPRSQASDPLYQGVLSHNVVTVATLLQDSGYHTYMAGKWHLGQSPELLPSSRGFERTVAMADTGADNWEQKPYLPIYKQANWFADGQRFQLPDDFYSSKYLIEKTIDFIAEQRNSEHVNNDRPFFAYIPFQAVHLPVQAPQQFIDKYSGIYDQGWSALRQQRQANAKALGLVPTDSQMLAMPDTVDWDSQSDQQKRYQAKRMAVYAGMVEAMDFHIGRLVAYLKASGQFENTVFIFTSDNGSEANGRDNPDTRMGRFSMARMDYHVDYDTLGLKGSFNSIGQSWASAAASPLAYYKFYAGEGGLRVPLIISGNVAGEPLVASSGHSAAFSYVTDITPTILSLANVNTPPERYAGRKVEPIVGRSLIPLIKGEAERIYSEQDAIGYEVAGNAALFQGDYKIVLNRGPVGDEQWRLFNIAADPGETTDLSSLKPQRLQTMLNLYHQYALDNGVLAVPGDYSQARQIALNGLQSRFAPNILLLLLTVIVTVPFYIAYRSQSN